MLRDTRGFTLIELLIVVVIIGILAAIAIPQFASTKERAFDATAKSDIRNAMAAQEAYYADNQLYSSAANVFPGNFTTSTGIAIDASGSAEGYSVTASHASSDNTYYVQIGAGGSLEGKIQSP
ncbi:MAG TPA: prepilin-type N-terminal cleavage/methylation domain-containing protein [Gemmatimonadota bacterium]|nr:prepilin-type N-terminal cleavage/methylation domain-containing protein [Gemmatimonadota bacterium]